ncbi:MAG: M20/M25/M40 family metallo-hydrolase, partial [Candidatus Limnocylindrales bacterium]
MAEPELADIRNDGLLAWLDQADPGIVELARSLVTIPSFAPTHGEHDVVAALDAAATGLGLPPGKIVAAVPDRPNLLIRIRGPLPGRRLILNGHTDTKPPGSRADWQHDPLQPVIEAGRLSGLGAADMKGALAAMLYAAAALRHAGLPARGEMILLFSADEEADGQVGLAHVLAATDLKANAALIGEPSGQEHSFDRLA